MKRKCHYNTLAGIDPLLLIAERMGKTLDHADDLSEDIHKYGPEALEDVNHKIDITDKDTNVGSGAPPPSGTEETKSGWSSLSSDSSSELTSITAGCSSSTEKGSQASGQ